MNNISSCLYNMLQKFNHTMMYPIINNNKIIISYYYTYNLWPIQDQQKIKLILINL